MILVGLWSVSDGRGFVGLVLICDVGMGMGRIWDQRGVSIDMDIVWHFIIGVLGVSGYSIWVTYPLLAAKGPATEGGFDYI